MPWVPLPSSHRYERWEGCRVCRGMPVRFASSTSLRCCGNNVVTATCSSSVMAATSLSAWYWDKIPFAIVALCHWFGSASSLVSPGLASTRHRPLTSKRPQGDRVRASHDHGPPYGQSTQQSTISASGLPHRHHLFCSLGCDVNLLPPAIVDLHRLAQCLAATYEDCDKESFRLWVLTLGKGVTPWNHSQVCCTPGSWKDAGSGDPCTLESQFWRERPGTWIWRPNTLRGSTLEKGVGPPGHITRDSVCFGSFIHPGSH